MSSVYMWNLPHAFPHLVQVEPDLARELVTHLIAADRIDAPDGSSFAVTVENPSRWRLWLSDVSYRYLEELDLLRDVERREM